MIGYTTVGTNDFERAARFYDDLFGSMGIERIFDSETFVAWGPGPKAPAFSICKPYNKEAASVGNGVMIAIALGSTEKVDAFHAKALELGATDEGAPGARIGNFYAGYFRDPDGNKLNGFCMTG
ncbi:MAG: VOC family protein [Woeseiaceae bacterium]